MNKLTEAIKLLDAEQEELYLKHHKACGLKVGDRVKVTRKAESYEKGWDTDWTPSMDGTIGKSALIINDENKLGFELGSKSFYPFFVLEKIASFDPEKIKVDQKGYVWDGDERPYKPAIRRFCSYLPACGDFLCYLTEEAKRETAACVIAWKHFEPIYGDDDE